MKRAKFGTRDGTVMLFALTLAFIVMMWLVLSGVLQINEAVVWSLDQEPRT